MSEALQCREKWWQSGIELFSKAEYASLGGGVPASSCRGTLVRGTALANADVDQTSFEFWGRRSHVMRILSMRLIGAKQRRVDF